jgi:hypothetical protein
MVDAPSVGMAAVDRGGCRHAKLVRSAAPAMAKPWTVSRRVGTAVSLRRVPSGAPIAAIECEERSGRPLGRQREQRARALAVALGLVGRAREVEDARVLLVVDLDRDRERRLRMGRSRGELGAQAGW